ncbi:hypothetical protein HP15_2865 [Marinobacter adhaerens HP15]|uniref:Uncharacterized protein n=1 Tax=Marinobacter adhaerens (strain DSM 23420 / HP15) TaxID=225937 RepID=E4PMB7_MARAH|nr:hypothetical protein HP15_2865 [Marinobacter adhaerens HP15]
MNTFLLRLSLYLIELDFYVPEAKSELLKLVRRPNAMR